MKTVPATIKASMPSDSKGPPMSLIPNTVGSALYVRTRSTVVEGHPRPKRERQSRRELTRPSRREFASLPPIQAGTQGHLRARTSSILSRPRQVPAQEEEPEWRSDHAAHSLYCAVSTTSPPSYRARVSQPLRQTLRAETFCRYLEKSPTLQRAARCSIKVRT